MSAGAATGGGLGRRVGGVALVVGWLALLAGVLVGFGALGSGTLATPALTDLGAWGPWMDQREPLTIAFAVLRLVVIAVAWYLVGVTVVGAVARLLRWGRLVTVADLLTVRSVRVLLQSALGMGLATAALASVQTPAAQGPVRPPTVATVAMADAQDALLRAPAGEEVASIRSIDTAAVVATMRPVDGGEQPVAQSVLWRTAPGEHFWSMAEQVLEASWGRAPTDAEVTPYWEQMVERNRGRLADPGNPDLVYPGQEFEVPPPPPAPPPP